MSSLQWWRQEIPQDDSIEVYHEEPAISSDSDFQKRDSTLVPQLSAMSLILNSYCDRTRARSGMEIPHIETTQQSNNPK